VAGSKDDHQKQEAEDKDETKARYAPVREATPTRQMAASWPDAAAAAAYKQRSSASKQHRKRQAV
jgi:hypothetical protein